MDKSIIYYTDNRLQEPINSVCQKHISVCGLPITSVSLKPMTFGNNIVLNLKPGVITMFCQILAALESAKTKYVFFCEHDVLYHKSHFDFCPLKDDVYYYNINVWRWGYLTDKVIGYDGLQSLSGMCCSRRLAIDHYKKIFKYIDENKLEDGRDPSWARKIGYEPGKKKHRGGLFNEKTDTWKSEYPLIDIRHRGVLTPFKISKKEFKHPPKNWREININYIPGWTLASLFPAVGKCF